MYVKNVSVSVFLSASGNSSQCDEINQFLRSHVVIRTVENIINSGSIVSLVHIKIHSALECSIAEWMCRSDIRFCLKHIAINNLVLLV